MRKNVGVEIAGQTLKIRSDENDDYLKGLAAYVDEKMRGISRGQQGITTLNLALTAALLIADELRKLEREQAKLDAALEKLSGRLEASMNEAAL